jgi:hypothetical protein
MAGAAPARAIARSTDLGLQDDRAVQLAPFVTLAKAGAQAKTKPFAWVPAFAGMTVWAVQRFLR